jgi:hypothetical protein
MEFHCIQADPGYTDIYDRILLGRPGNPQERSFTVETEPGTDTLAAVDQAVPAKPTPRTKGMALVWEFGAVS